MTRKLTDEQVQAIIKNWKNGHISHVQVPFPKIPDTVLWISSKQVLTNRENAYIEVECWEVGIDYLLEDKTINNRFYSQDEAIAYAEHLLNQRYCWLPQQQAWIMSGEVYNFANNGANKVLELSLIAWQNGFKEDKEDWFFAEFNNEGKVYQEIHGGFPSVELIKGVTIPAESPIWDAVKEVE